MKISLKIVMGTMFIVVVMFSISGILLIHENFKNSYNLQIEQNIEEHYLEKYSIENNINDHLSEDGVVNTKELENYLYILTSYLENSRKLAIYIDNDLVWNNIPFKIENESLDKKVTIKTYESKTYSLINSKTIINNEKIVMMSAYDISGIFEVRDKNLIYFYIIDIVLILLCGVFTTILAKFIAKPIHILNDTTKKVANGNLDVAVEKTTNDEIGELSLSFNSMVSAVKQRQKELELSIKQREDFVSNFTHELKTPMTSIMGYTKVLQQDKYSKEDKIMALDYIYSETKRLEILSHKLLSLLGLSEEKLILTEINCKDFFENLKVLAEKRLNEINLILEIEESDILGDEVLLVTCFINLIENAKKASTPKDEIIINGKIVNKKYRVSIIDHGIGIATSEINRITEDFYMIDKARSKSYGGYGLGLGIAQKIAHLHNTKLSFESKVGIGTKVSLDLEVTNAKKK